MNKPQVTVIYYTSNREEEFFESRVRKRLMEVTEGIPIISVSHKPIDLGENICVGEHSANDFNLYRQIQIGCKAAKTPFVISAEADCIYPPEYFGYVPKNPESFYRYANIWILYKKFEYFFQKSSSECAMMGGRDFYIKQIDKMLEGQPEWNETPKDKIECMAPLWNWKVFGVDGGPVISFKTNKGLRQFTRTIQAVSDIKELPYWGTVNNLKKEFGLCKL